MKARMVFLNLVYKLNNSPYLMAIKNATIRLIPLILVIAFLTLISNFLSLLQAPASVVIFTRQLTVGVTAAYPYLLAFAISYYLSIIKRKDFRLHTGTFTVLALIVFNVIVNNTLSFGLEIKFIRAVLVSLINYELYFWLFDKLSSHKKSEEMKYAFIDPKSILFLFLYVLLFSLIAVIYQKFYSILDSYLIGHIHYTSSFVLSMFYTFLYIFPWIFGLHGIYVNFPYHDYLQANQLSNHTIAELGFNNFEILTSNFYSLFVHIGGSGATLSFLIALFLSKKKSDKMIAKLALIPSLFNINEILIFGFPIIINLYLIIPFLLVPTLFTGLSYFAISYGLIPIITENISWIIPPFLNSLVFSKGDLRIFLWQCFLVTIGTFIYKFFLERHNKFSGNLVNEDLNILYDLYLDDTNNQENLEILARNTNARIKLKDLMSNGKFILFYQPIINMSNKQNIKLEALVRIDHKTKGIIPPYFLEYFRALNQLVLVDFWVMTEVFKTMKVINQYNPEVEISINISSNTFMDTRFIPKLIELCQIYTINPGKIILELVEEVCISDLNFAKDKIKNLKELGFQIAIDDFGTGYSSLSYLLDLEVDYIKIDRKFILGIKEKKGQIILSNIIHMAKSIKSKVVAEGVEEIQEVTFLEGCNVDYIQGFFYSKPLPIDDIIEYLIVNKK